MKFANFSKMTDRILYSHVTFMYILYTIIVCFIIRVHKRVTPQTKWGFFLLTSALYNCPLNLQIIIMHFFLDHKLLLQFGEEEKNKKEIILNKYNDKNKNKQTKKKQKNREKKTKQTNKI